ncbi:pentatricopeptide repeat-containing protein At2g22410, mitochondrial-like [Humulus lupulus]|uniref:pentatricopeptide repeat-containing protein At2g22410, mitochondrial-like n=1 Tax=Humulus lupulus TaxID=3486 RepID=UPI002B414491|nr:pentatricopeptide repeat-containing protein At2g22410, mitochondrial-like [Humulus lupulus]XP_062090182.1 pentatricopeptide repeat-containing protein At2g22410, mitochondrial-like [Humulus lupulus]XP_062090183.1 pentatricopeptide repeat-containing protein At2g22410, mitochondrial-like [Humulus lupulus]XP_062090184.1 pentatricopeptide repeat-containing protein At2g22410, mitochondrial-like [Humulus lupulus]XP_062090185.1 pentatricopeptide repeat-containing protein At2g22410, mitochondrial-lik
MSCKDMKLARPITRCYASFALDQPKNLMSISSIKELHARLIRGNLHKDPYSVSEVIKAYALSLLNLDKAHLVFDLIERPTLFVWNNMIRGLSQSDQPRKAIDMHNRMYSQGLIGDNLTFLFVLRACARVYDVLHGQKIHVHAVKLGFETYLFVGNALIHMYSSCGKLDFAQKLFDEMTERDLVSWNSLICGYTKWNRFKDVLGLFETMQVADVRPDSVTMMKVILACSYLGQYGVADSLVKHIKANHVNVDVFLGNTIIDMYGRRSLVMLAREVFDQMRERNIVSWNALIVGYLKVGNLVIARELFNEMPKRDVVSWTAMITGYSQANRHTEAVRLFQEMMAAKVKPDEITIASVISACAHLGSLDVGEAIHEYIFTHGVRADIWVGNALVDMYCKCGVAEKALKVFQEMKTKDSVSWTSIISGLAVNGFANLALEIFSQMLKEGRQPTHGTFVGIFLACAHTGLVDKGLNYFQTMEKVYGLKPEMKHYGCVVDLLSRSGYLEKAYDFIIKMPVVPDAIVWRILLNACKLYGNVALAEVVTKKLLEVDPCNSGNYVLSSSTYAGIERWDDVEKMRQLMNKNNVQKSFGYSSIEVNGLTSN